MIRAQPHLAAVVEGIPRESGDDPRPGSPHRCGLSVFPARAGMILDPPAEWLRRGGIPRESGDDPVPGPRHLIPQGYSPRERG